MKTSMKSSRPKDIALPRVVPGPIYRHAAPSGPWPWMNLGVESNTTDTTVVDKSWKGYLQNQFRNWTPEQVKRNTIVKSSQDQDDFWGLLQRERPENIRVRSLFVDDLTQPVLRMLGAKYDIEPFFFTSAINCIPSQYQEASHHGGDPEVTTPLTNSSSIDPEPWGFVNDSPIDIQAPVSTSDGRMLFIDLAIHMVRDVKTNTIISYHPESAGDLTSAKHLHSLIQLAGESVYWQKIFKMSKDPTFLFLVILWYALYAWDESLDLLYQYVGELELQVLHLDNISLTHDLYVLQARLLHYQSLIHGFEVSVTFIETTPNPAMESYDKATKDESDALMKRECKNLLGEIDRLERRRKMLSKRLKNAMDLAFAIVNAEDSRRMQRFSYLTMVFLPASFIARIADSHQKNGKVTSILPLRLYVLVDEVQMSFKSLLQSQFGFIGQNYGVKPY
ncbi:hypothetical protein BDR04DRAFT_1144244 [Suillus decipiens]|nr:hypothetical protein BDR04DRAFT_1144244 [Suillus decipiens]